MKLVTTEQSQSSGVVTKPAKPISYQEYYQRYGFLPPGFTTVVDGKEIVGGCSLWREWANSQNYPQEPAPYATKQHKDDYQRRLDEIYRPWLRGA